MEALSRPLRASACSTLQGRRWRCGCRRPTAPVTGLDRLRVAAQRRPDGAQFGVLTARMSGTGCPCAGGSGPGMTSFRRTASLQPLMIPVRHCSANAARGRFPPRDWWPAAARRRLAAEGMAMPLRRIYDNWGQLNAASGIPRAPRMGGVAGAATARRLLGRFGSPPAVPQSGPAQLLAHRRHVDPPQQPGLTAARITPAACANNAERFASRGFDLLCVSAGGNDCSASAGRDLRRPRAHGRRRRVRRGGRAGTFDACARYAADGADVRRRRPLRVLSHGYAPPSRHAISSPAHDRARLRPGGAGDGHGRAGCGR